jgi:integrase
MAEGYAEHLTGLKLQANSFNKKVQALSLIFRVLSEPGRLTANVWDKIRRKRQVSQSRRELTVEELKRIVEGAKGEMRLLLGIGIYTGLRLGDCSTLRWGEVDLVRRIIRRIPMKTARRKATPVIVPIHGTLLNMLKQLPRNAKSDYVLPEIAATYARDDSAVSKQIQKLFSDNGITTTRDGTGYILVQGEDGKQKKQYTGKRAVVEVGFHSLRHTFVSLCRGADAPLSVVESIVGHSSPAMTQHYSHTGETALRDAVTSLPDITGETVKALPAAVVEDEAATLKAKIKEIAGKLTARNAGKMKTALLTLAG